MFWNNFKKNVIFNSALAFTITLHIVVLMILIHAKPDEEKYLNLSQVVIHSVDKNNKIIPVLKEPEDPFQIAKRFETNTNAVIKKETVPVLKVEGTGDDNLSNYVSIKAAPQFVTPIYSLIIYPEFEKESHIEGEVIYEVYLKSTGEIKTVNILKATTKAMGDAVLAALSQAKILPPYGADGKPFACRFRQRLPFRITQR